MLKKLGGRMFMVEAEKLMGMGECEAERVDAVFLKAMEVRVEGEEVSVRRRG